jgi:hypothetical protein
MAVVSKQTLLDYFCSGGRATNATSTIEYELEDLIDSCFAGGIPSSVFVPSLGGNDAAGSARTWMDGTINTTVVGINIERSGTAAGIWGNPYDTSTLTAVPVMANNDTATITLGMTFAMKTWQSGQTGAIEYETTTADHSYTKGDLNWATELETSIACVQDDLVTFNVVTNDSCVEIAVWGWYCTLA